MMAKGAGGDGEPLRILLLINDLARGGAEAQLVGLAIGLRDRGHHVEIALLKNQNAFADRLARVGIPVTALRRAGFWDVALPFRLYAMVRATRPAVLQSSLFLSNLHGALVGRLCGVPAVIASQRCSYNATLSPLLRFVARWSHRRAHAVIVNSASARHEEIAAGFDAGRIVYVPNGIAVDLTAARSPSRRDLGLPAEPLVLCVGRLEAFKGQSYLLEAWPSVLLRAPNAVLALVGEGPLRPSLMAATRRLGIEKSVRFLGHRPSATPFISTCDLLAQASVTEGMPNVVAEAAALGRAVVATAVGGTPELLDGGRCGVLVPPADSNALADAIAGLLLDPSRRAALGETARQFVLERFPTANVVAAMENVYREALGRRIQPEQ